MSGIALLFSTAIGIPLGAALGLRRFFGRRLLVALMYTGMGFPPVVVGLFVYLLLSRSGPARRPELAVASQPVYTRRHDHGAVHHRASHWSQASRWPR